MFQLHVDVQRPVQKARTSASCAILLGGRNGCVNDAPVVGQSHVGIGTEHEDFLPVHHHFCILGTVYFPEVWIHAFGFHFLRKSVTCKFLL